MKLGSGSRSLAELTEKLTEQLEDKLPELYQQHPELDPANLETIEAIEEVDLPLPPQKSEII